MVGDAYARDAVKKMAGATIDSRLFRMLMLDCRISQRMSGWTLLRNF